MVAVTVEITKFVDESQPGWVECKLVDAYGREHLFIEKVPVVCLEDLDASSIYPQPGVIACELIERISVGAAEIVKINSERPYAIESVDGNVLFDVQPDQLVDS